MNSSIQKINPTTIEHEGFFFLELDGSYFKGCRRCGGTGHYSYDGMSSDCYLCNNSSAKLGEPLESYEAGIKWCHTRAMARKRREAKKEQERLAKLAKREEAQLAVKEIAPEVYDFLMSDAAYESRNSFVAQMSSVFQYHIGTDRRWTEKMTDAIRRHLSTLAREEADAAAHPVVEGRIVIRGEIMSAKVVETDFGTAYKILVKDERGFKVWGSLPKAQADEAYDLWYAEMEKNGDSLYDFGPAVWLLGGGHDGKYAGVKGRGITFSATVKASDDDKAFGFFSRPTKGAWLA